MVLLLLVPVVVLVACLERARAVDGDEAAAWAARHGIRLTAGSEPMVTWYLRTSRTLRVLGVSAGVALPPFVALALGLDDELRGPRWPWVFAGYLLAAVYAEVALVRRAPDGPRTAALHPRQLDEYLPIRLVTVQRALGLAATAGFLAALVLADEERGARLVGLASAVVVTVGLEVVARWLVRRPQPFRSADLIAADDAIRSQSVHSVAGSGIALLLLLAGAAAFDLAGSDVQLLRWTMLWPALLAWPLALLACNHYGHRPWPAPRRLVGP